MTTAGDTALAETSSGVVFPPEGVGVVVFDVVGTLVEPSPSVAVAYQQAGRVLAASGPWTRPRAARDRCRGDGGAGEQLR